MTDSAGDNLRGVAVLDTAGKVIARFGVACDDRIRAMLGDRDWMKSAQGQRLSVLSLSDVKYLAAVTPFRDGQLVAIFTEGGETTTKFLLSVDFAFDIFEQLLSDPFDGMAVIDSEERLVFVSPIHEKFFGLTPGSGVGRKVRDVIENTRLHEVLRTGVAEIGQIQKMRGSERVVSRLPIRHAGKVVGAIGRVMFKGPQQLEAMAERIKALESEIATIRTESLASSEGEKYLTNIVGQSAAMVRLRDMIRKIAVLDIPVLIQGESGTGKELVAQALHLCSPRREARLVTVNAAALPAQLVESELFGYEAGSFTGADRKGRAGKFEQADRGTIFLDEIGDMPLETQSKLLRVLQDRVVERVGSDRPRKLDFRLCSATNRNLEDFVDTGKFRLDLYYRISPVVIQVPPLTDRLEDIPLLLDHFLNELSLQYRREVPRIESGVTDYLSTRNWPGNVRELRHAVERAFVFCSDDALQVANFRETSVQSIPMLGKALVAASGGGGLRETLDRVERELVFAAMEKFNGNKKRAAEYLGVSRSYLYKILGE